MFLADKGVTNIRRRWYHDPNRQSSHGLTVAMYYAKNGIIPPNRWQHEPDL